MSYREKYERNWIKPGIEVVCIDNTDQKMVVEDIIRQERKNGDLVIRRIIGVRCQWWVERPNGEKIFKNGLFHTRRLVPYEILGDSRDAVDKFFDEVVNNS